METRPSKPSPFNTVTIFGGFFALAGFSAFLAISGPQILRYFQSQRWDRVPTLLSSLTGDSRWNTRDGSPTQCTRSMQTTAISTKG